ncbi:MAG: replication-associated recombination protein A [Lachnospiraceae bacterium]|nr:replication-associated recombination protein A [Lachnospiraceae bacterium]MBQ2031317.1 replication-associated recombination protein A [Lachnospiraceae bacterium]
MQQLSMFDMMGEPTRKTMPLAGRVRPKTLSEFVGQEHLLGPGCMLRTLIESDRISSMIFWGPPGVGKTTLASIIAGQTKSEFINFSAVTSGIKEIKDVMKQSEDAAMRGIRTVLFVDEIHRFNKAQQDAFLPYVEKGSIILIGATTENPSFEVNGALLSRCKVFVLKPLTTDNIVTLLKHALASPEGFGNNNVQMSEEQIRAIAEFAGGDARTALNTLEMAVLNGTISAEGITVTDEQVTQCISRKSLLYDKSGEEHYNLISALHKSMRNSDPDAAVYWALRMLDSGDDPLYIARRLVRFASEDVGIADSNALAVAINVYQACHYLGVPECNVHIAHAAAYLAMAPKSNALEVACMEVSEDLRTKPAEPVPLWIRNAPTKLMADLDYGKGYRYAHNYEGALTPMPCLPESLAGREYYRPKQSGAEAAVADRLKEIKAWKEAHKDEWSTEE